MLHDAPELNMGVGINQIHAELWIDFHDFLFHVHRAMKMYLHHQVSLPRITDDLLAPPLCDTGVELVVRAIWPTAEPRLR